MNLSKILSLFALILFSISFVSAQSVSAATLTVANAGDSGAGSLRDTIAAAASGDTIVFDTAGVFSTPQTITLASELLIDKSLTIQGPGLGSLTVSGGNTVRVFNIAAGNFDVTIGGMTIANGINAEADVSDPVRGGVIYNASTGRVTVNNSRLSGDSTSRVPGGTGGLTGCMTFFPPPDGPFSVGDIYDEAGLRLIGQPFYFSNGADTGAGRASKSPTAYAGGSPPEMQLNNISLGFGTISLNFTKMEFKFAERGGNLNLEINGERAVFDNFADINGTMLGGVYVAVTGGNGQDSGDVALYGEISTFSIGGQELWIDDLCFTDATDPNGQPIATKSDLGDAPDSNNHFGNPYTNTAYTVPSIVPGRFPTTFDPATATPAQGQGPKHASIAHMWLGTRVTAENEADQLPDNDAFPNILHLGADVADMDNGDDGWLNRNAPYSDTSVGLVPAAAFNDGQTTQLAIRVTRSSMPLPSTMTNLYLNVWFDGMGDTPGSTPDGDWQDAKETVPGTFAREWIVRNATIPVLAANSSQVFVITTDRIPNNAPTGKHWMRFTLSEQPAVTRTNAFDADGRGTALALRMGETEDVSYDPNPPPASSTDLGDAPDNTNHWGTTNTAYTFPALTPARFPTVWNSGVANDPSGPRHLNATIEGTLGIKITGEADADTGPDAEVINNIKTGGIDSANLDQGDDSWLNPQAVMPNCATTTLKVRVRRGPAAALPTMYLNVFFDGNRDGDWEDIGQCPGQSNEWVVQNQLVDMTAIPLGGFADLNVPTRLIHNPTPTLTHWVRLTLSEGPAVINSGLSPPRSDGRGPQQPGSFMYGETEDYIVEGQAPGQPGTFSIAKSVINAWGINTAGRIITYVIELQHGGGTLAATTTLTDQLPAEVIPLGSPTVTEPWPGAGPLEAALSGSLLTWNGSINPGGKIRIEQRVRVMPCTGGGQRTITNTASALQTATGGGGVIAAQAGFDELCTSPTGTSPISGIKTVCAAGCDYQTLTGSINSPALGIFSVINNSVVTGNIEIQIAGDLNEIFPGPIAELIGGRGLNPLLEYPSGSNYTVKIYPTGAARTITGSNGSPGDGPFNSALIGTNGSSRVTIDGSIGGTGTDRSLTINNASYTTPTAVRFGSTGTTPITNNTLKNCVIINGSNANSAVVISDAANTGNPGYFANITIQNNDVRRASTGVFANGGTTPQNGSNLIVTENTINTAGASAVRNVGLLMLGVNGATVSGNTVGNQDTAGIWLGLGTTNATVSGNTVATLGYTGGTAPTGINVTSGVSATSINVTGNSVSNITTNGTNAARGISVSDSTGDMTIQKNNVQGIINTRSTGASGAYGIDISGGNNIAVKNNFVSNVTGDMTGGGAFSTTDGIFGIRVGSGTGHQIYHNSVNLYGTRAGAPASSLLTAAFGIVSAASTGMDVRNNIFANNITGGTTSVANVSAYLPSGGTAAMNLTWNNNAYYFGTDAASQGPGQAGTTAGTNFFTTLPALAAYSATLSPAATNDSASLASTAAAPFVTNNDLHVPATAGAILGGGTTIGGVSSDIDMDPRPGVMPDIGADELVQSQGGSIPAGTYYNAAAGMGDSLGGNVTVTNTMYLNGKLTTGANTLTIDCNGLVTGAGGTNYVIGNLAHRVCLTGGKAFDVGSANGYSPVTITVTALGTMPSSLTISSTNSTIPGVAASSGLARYWTLTKTGDLTADLVFNYLNADVLGTEATYQIAKRESGMTNFVAGGSVNAGANQLSISGVSNFSDWGAGNALAPTAAGVSVGGRVLTPDGRGLRNAIVQLSDLQGNTRTAHTGSFGYYRFDGVEAGQTYVVGVASKRYVFTPRTISVSDELTDLDFIAQ